MEIIGTLDLHINVYNDKEGVEECLKKALDETEQLGQSTALITGGQMTRPSLSAFTKVVHGLGLDCFGVGCEDYKNAIVVARSTNAGFVRLSAENPLQCLREASELRERLGLDYLDLYLDIGKRELDRLNAGQMHGFVEPKEYFRRNDAAILLCDGMSAESIRICTETLKSVVGRRVYLTSIDSYCGNSGVKRIAENADGLIVSNKRVRRLKEILG